VATGFGLIAAGLGFVAAGFGFEAADSNLMAAGFRFVAVDSSLQENRKTGLTGQNPFLFSCFPVFL